MNNKNLNFLKNVFYAIGAQIISLSASLVVSFIAPKLIDVSNYAFWQVFLFYVTYINITRFGLLDGLYLRLGGKEYKELNHKLLSNEWAIFVLFQIIIASILFMIIMLSNMMPDRKFVFGMCCLCMVIINSNNFFSFILQSVNQTKRYSVSIMIQNIIWFVAVAIIVVFKIYSYKVIVICYTIGHILAGIYLAYYAKEIWHLKKYPLKETLQDIKINISCGIFLMISSYAGSLIIGSARIIIDGALGVEVFGYFSFSLTLSNFLLTFINQVSMVMFPTLKSMKNNKQLDTYILVRDLLSLILPCVLLGYLPICILIHIWLPEYIPSLQYLVFFLPLCTYDGKMQMLCSTYFKVLRKERLFMIINLITMILSSLFAFIGCYLVKNIYFVACSILLVIALRSIVSEIILAKLMDKKVISKIILETLLVVIFITLTITLNIYIAPIVYLIVYLIYLYFNRSIIKKIVGKFLIKKTIETI